jgi:Xaa-Pro aminopeptidase
MDLAHFATRRKSALERLGSDVLVLFSAKQTIRNNDVENPYRQDSDFFYLTGLEDPGLVLVLSGGKTPTTTLFVTEQDPVRAQWDGPTVSLSAAKDEYGADQALPMGELTTKLPELLMGHDRAYFALGRNPDDDTTFIAALKRARARARRTGRAPTELRDIEEVVHELRRIKAPEELAAMRRANEVSKRAHRLAMAGAKPGVYEFELRSILEHEFIKSGSARPAYESIVGSGPNATILHYIKNTRQLEEGDLVLIDAGCELDYYASDITRTFPVSGKFSDAQRQVYEIVLAAQNEAIAAVKPGVSFSDLHSISLRVLVQGLIDLGFIAGPIEEAIEEKRHRPYFMHKTGHYLGMDVHDVGSYRQGEAPRPFEPGVVITVEPGLYISADNDDVPAEYRGIGVRIEDDILVTETGHENLSAGLAKTVEDVESACAA